MRTSSHLISDGGRITSSVFSVDAAGGATVAFNGPDSLSLPRPTAMIKEDARLLLMIDGDSEGKRRTRGHD